MSRRAAAKPCAPHLGADAVIVSNCADNGDFDTLRHAVLVANPGDTIDMSGLTCDKITLGSAIVTGLDDLTIVGPGAGKLTIDGSQAGRVFGAGHRNDSNMTVANGLVTADPRPAAVYSKGDVTLSRSVVTSCTANSHLFGGRRHRRLVMLAKSSGCNLASTGRPP
jgi:hypothetical protein